MPGYAAPPDTIDPAARVAFALLTVVVDGVAAGEITTGAATVPRAVRADFAQLRARGRARRSRRGAGPARCSRGSQLFGSISLEMFGHLHNVIHDYDAYFAMQMRRAAEFLTTGT